MSKNIRILMFGPDLNATGGIASVVNNWIASGLKDYIDLRYISTIDYNGDGQKCRKIFNALRAYYIYLFINKSEYDLVHLHLASRMSFYRKLIIFIIAKLKRDKIIVHLHGAEFEKFYFSGYKLRKSLIKWIFNSSSIVIVLSTQWEKFVQRICQSAEICILYNGANPDLFIPFKRVSKRINILFMGELGSRKGTYDLVQAFSEVHNKIPKSNLILGGDGEIFEMKKIINQLGIQERVEVKGWLSGKEKIDAFREADIYVLPSYNEGLPVSVLEAMAAGLPIISTPVGGTPEAVLSGENGILLDPGDIYQLGNALVKLCNEHELRKSMGECSLELINSKFHIKKIVRDLFEIYKKQV